MKDVFCRQDRTASPSLWCQFSIPSAVRPASFLPRPLRWLFLSALLPLMALAEPVEFDLPAQSAGDALLAFSKQAKIEVLFSSDELRLTQSVAVTGTHEPDEALSRLLLGTGFAARQNRKGKFVVTRLKRSVGAILGRLLAADGAPARGLRVTIPGMRLSTTTDEHGAFNFALVPPGTYRLVASGPGLKPLLLSGLKVEANQVLTVNPPALQATEDLVRLDPYVVKAESAWPIDPSWDALAPRLAGGAPAHFGVIHADPRTPDVAELIAEIPDERPSRQDRLRRRAVRAQARAQHVGDAGGQDRQHLGLVVDRQYDAD